MKLGPKENPMKIGSAGVLMLLTLLSAVIFYGSGVPQAGRDFVPVTDSTLEAETISSTCTTTAHLLLTQTRVSSGSTTSMSSIIGIWIIRLSAFWWTPQSRLIRMRWHGSIHGSLRASAAKW